MLPWSTIRKLAMILLSYSDPLSDAFAWGDILISDKNVFKYQYSL